MVRVKVGVGIEVEVAIGVGVGVELGFGGREIHRMTATLSSYPTMHTMPVRHAWFRVHYGFVSTLSSYPT